MIIIKQQKYLWLFVFTMSSLFHDFGIASPKLIHAWIAIASPDIFTSVARKLKWAPLLLRCLLFKYDTSPNLGSEKICWYAHNIMTGMSKSSLQLTN